MELEKGKVTICIVNYKTFDFTRLCLRSIRKFTAYPYEVLVIDNNSQDDSLEYLKKLKWIRLVQRDTSKDKSGSFSHAAALDLGLANCETEFFASMHSDAFVQKAGWLAYLVDYFDNDSKIACVGTGKLELKPQWQVWLQRVTDIRTFKRKILNEPDPLGQYRYYNRTIFCLYRTEILKREKLSFLMDNDKGLTGGQKLYFELVDKGCKTVELPPKIVEQYIIHLAHATQVVNRKELTLQRRPTYNFNNFFNRVKTLEITKELTKSENFDKLYVKNL